MVHNLTVSRLGNLVIDCSLRLRKVSGSIPGRVR